MAVGDGAYQNFAASRIENGLLAFKPRPRAIRIELDQINGDTVTGATLRCVDQSGENDHNQ